MADLEMLSKEDISNIEDFLDSAKLNLLTENLNISYYLFPKKENVLYLCSGICVPELYSEKFFNLFSLPEYIVCNSIFTKSNNKYFVNHNYNFGSIFSNDNFVSEIKNEIYAGEEWKLNLDDKIKLIDFNETINLSRQLAKKIINKNFKEIDERNLASFQREQFYSFPSLVHRFGITGMPYFYKGSEIYLERESLTDSKLKNNLIDYFNFFKNIR